ncbi:Abi family protein [Mycoplasma yeatsii]|uniref:Abortive infection bacteriophage resistance protein n=1 Tax=Mycoplasma yeatsii TaxID=51365 RepID=A0ABU0NEM6_9MOLU|nr:Abi family protein [Mycoplasma yeatsii]MDQ0567844.1 abortive infection bacteriophage resistance protein [Mycoplasma yeatsii]
MRLTKEFKTFEQQIEILKSRVSVIEDEQKVIEILKQENYYNIINGYKDLFLDDNKNDKECFKNGTTFDEIYSLFLFDRELRSIILKYILLFERDFKTIMSYNFSQKYNTENRVDSYLYPQNYRDDYVNVLNFISTVNNIITSKSEKTSSIKHYIQQYGHVPLWVVVNIMSFDNMSFMFKILKDSDKNYITLFYLNRYLKEYNIQNDKIRLKSSSFMSGLKALNIARNICAHEERMYNVTFNRVPINDISKIIDYSILDESKLITVFMFLKITLTLKHFLSLKEEVLEVFNKFKKRFKTITFEEILKEMGIKVRHFAKL